MKRIVAGTVTLALMAGIAMFGKSGKDAEPRAASTLDAPSACVERMFGAAVRGDVDRYLDCFTGDALLAIRRNLDADRTLTAAAALKNTVGELKGWVVVDSPAIPDDSIDGSIVVQRVYAGRVDRQRLGLRKEGDQWRICEVSRPESQQPVVPYGTLIYAESR